jgi:hypothetical protein
MSGVERSRSRRMGISTAADDSGRIPGFRRRAQCPPRYSMHPAVKVLKRAVRKAEPEMVEDNGWNIAQWTWK